MRSPVTYRTMHDNKILPLPDVRTIGRYLSQMDCRCGFDPRFFEILKAHFSDKSLMQLHGLLQIDEMSTRKGLLLDRKTMKFKGVEDFGNGVSEERSKVSNNDMVDHGLVIMLKPLYDNYSQPIAVFASKGPTRGDVLDMLMVQAIIFLEKAGAKIHGIVADGGKPNRKMWAEMGCSGKMDETFKNWFEHPMDGGRKVYLFSDAPHLIKTIRNRLASSGKLQIYPKKCPVLWEHLAILQEIDKLQPAAERICPKITDAHIDVMKNSFAKMGVSLVLQIFSKSAARGLRYFKNIKKRLKDCESTVEFYEILNNMFDALNRTSLQTALRLGCDDIQSFLGTIIEL